MRQEDEVDAFSDELDAKLENIKTRDDLAQFVRMLLRGVNNEMFEDQGLPDYISGLYGVINGLDGLEKNTGIPNPDPPDWKLLGRILLYAFYHS
jgi:hypothetical protein